MTEKREFDLCRLDKAGSETSERRIGFIYFVDEDPFRPI
jgi:hypothetical protein